jgi:hypothetical protein
MKLMGLIRQTCGIIDNKQQRAESNKSSSYDNKERLKVAERQQAPTTKLGKECTNNFITDRRVLGSSSRSN